MRRQRIQGVSARDHRYAPAGEAVPAGTLIGVTIRVKGTEPIRIGVDAVDLDTATVTAWQISRPGGGWIDGPSWTSIDDAVAVARDPARVRALVEYERVRDEAWLTHRRAAQLDKHAAALLAAATG